MKNGREKKPWLKRNRSVVDWGENVAIVRMFAGGLNEYNVRLTWYEAVFVAFRSASKQTWMDDDSNSIVNPQDSICWNLATATAWLLSTKKIKRFLYDLGQPLYLSYSPVSLSTLECGLFGWEIGCLHEHHLRDLWTVLVARAVNVNHIFAL